MKIAIIVFPGSNCDRDARVAIEKTLGSRPIMHWHGDSELPNVDCIILPGGFSYGDYLRSGAMAAHSPVMKEVVLRANKGVRVIGICNGFQILTEVGLLPGVLMRNTNLKFVCKNVWLSVQTSNNIFTSGYKKGELINIPIAHHDGNYFVSDTELKVLQDNDRIAFRYVTASGVRHESGNPNGSLDDIAGILNEKKNILGMMPHPERAIDDYTGSSSGSRIFAALHTMV